MPTYLDLEPGEVGRVLLELDERHLDVFFVVTDYYRRYERRRRDQDRYNSITSPVCDEVDLENRASEAELRGGMSEAKGREPRPRARDKTHQSACQMKAQLLPLGLIALALIVQTQSPTREKDFVDDHSIARAIVALWV